MKKISNLKKYAFLAAAVLGFNLVQSCTENIDMSDRYTFTEYTVESYLTQHDTTYSEYLKLLGEVPISINSKSSVRQLLSARGKFTVFAPTNKAIQAYLDSLTSKGIISSPSWDAFPDQATLDSIRKVIVYNSIIDGKDVGEPYQTATFPNDGEEINTPNMNERKLTVLVNEKFPDSIYINGNKDMKTKVIRNGSLIDLKNRDIIAINGCIHQMHSVVAPSNETVADVIKNIIDTKDETFLVFAKLVMACGLQDTLSKEKDEVYENLYLTNQLKDLPKHPSYNWRVPEAGFLPEHRKYGFTIFAETDDFWSEQFGGKPAADITVDEVKQWVIDRDYYHSAKDNGNYKDPQNVLNQFVTYHILPMRIPVDKLVMHYNEKGYYYNPSSNPYTIPVSEIYTTMGEPRLLKIYEGGKNAPKGIYLNRFPNLDNGRHGSYHELSCDPDKQGLLINTTDVRNVVNGYIYPISGVLTYDMETRRNFQKQRMRFDVAGLFPEFLNNNIRGNRTTEHRALCVGIPDSKTYQYIEKLDIQEGTQFYYLSGYNEGWQNMQGDEFNVSGNYEMTFTLPPVPMKGTYEIRFAVQNNSSNRGMCQVYFGSNKSHMPAMGIPLDMRIGGTSPILGWESDKKDDDDYNAEVDKKMRNNGFMKGPEYYHAGTASAALARGTNTTTRRIIVRQEMEPGKQYYLKFKSVLESTTKEFYMDYIEYCDKNVYDNPDNPEDIW